jgi:chromosome segregation ATPase
MLDQSSPNSGDAAVALPDQPTAFEITGLPTEFEALATKVRSEVRAELAELGSALQRAEKAEALAAAAREELADARQELEAARRDLEAARDEAERRAALTAELYVFERERARELAAWRAQLLESRWPWRRAAMIRAARRGGAPESAAASA